MTIRPQAGPGASWRGWRDDLLIALLFAGLAVCAVVLTRETGRVATIWPANAVLVATMIQRGGIGARLVGLAGAANALVNLLMGDPLGVALLLPAANVTEACLCTALALRGSRGALDWAVRRDLWRFLTGAVAAAALSTALATLGLGAISGLPHAETAAVWFSADLLGLLVFTPLYMLLGGGAWRPLFASGQRRETAALFLLLSGVLALVFLQSSLPLLFVVAPVLVLIAFRAGLAGVALAVFVIAAAAVGALLTGRGPAMLIDGDLTDRMLMVQVFLAATVLTALPVAGAVAHRDRLGQDLRRSLDEAEAARAAAAASEARYRLIAANTSDVIAEIGLDGRNTFVSEACLAVLGRTPESLIGRSTLEIVHPEDGPGLERAFRSLARERRSRLDSPVRYRASTLGGEWRWMEANPTLVFDADGRPLRFVDVVRDVTRQKATEAALEAALAEAEAASAAKAEFLANMSHELRTPLTAIIGFAGLLQQFGTLNDQDRRFVSRISAGADTLLAMVGDVLDYSKLEAGAVELHQEEVELCPLIQDALAMVGAPAAEKQLTLSVKTHGLLHPTLVVDRTRLRQVLMNLMSNAVKFTAAGSVTVKAESVHGDRVLFSIVDTGVGIPADRQHRLFQRFSQADGSTVRDYGGTGLGLAICKALVEAMGGEIGLRSAAGEGSTFWFVLPRAGVPIQESIAA